MRAVLMSSQQEAEIIQDRTGFITEETRLKLHLHCCVGPRACIFRPTMHGTQKELCTSSNHGNAFKTFQCKASFIPSSTGSEQHLDLGGRLLKKRELKTFGGVYLQRKAMNKPTRRDFCLVTLNTWNQRLQGAQSQRRSMPESKYIYLIKCTWLHYHYLKIDSTPGHTISLISSPFPFRGKRYTLERLSSR